MWNRQFSCNDSWGAILKAGEQKRKGYCIHFYSNLPSCPYMHHLSTHILRLYSHIYRKWGNTTHVDWRYQTIWRVTLSIFLFQHQADIIYSLSPYTHMSICLVFTRRNVPWGSHIKLADHSHVGCLSCPHLQSGRRHCINNSATI